MAQIGILFGFILNLPVASRFEDQYIGRLVLYEDEPPKTLNGATHFIAKELLDLWTNGLAFTTTDGLCMNTKVALLFTKADWPALTKLSGITICMQMCVLYCILTAAGVPSHSSNTPCPRCNETDEHECEQATCICTRCIIVTVNYILHL